MVKKLEEVGQAHLEEMFLSLVCFPTSSIGYIASWLGLALGLMQVVRSADVALEVLMCHSHHLPLVFPW